MQHDHAIRTQAAERYLLGQMTAAERDAYEEHYFSCAECESELAAAAVFIDNAREALASKSGERADAIRSTEPAAPAVVSWWKRLFVAPPRPLVPALSAAVLVLLVFTGYQQLGVIPELRQRASRVEGPRHVPALALRSASRGVPPSLQVSSDDQYAVLQADVLADTPVARYTAVLSANDGTERFRTSMPAVAAGMPTTILVPLRDLPPGGYTLVFYDDAPGGREVGRFAFTIDKQ
jgi:anti-sigma factor RsiW